MGLLGYLLALPLLGPVKGLAFIAEKLEEQGLQELMDETGIQQQLMELELRHEFGEIDGEEYLSREEALMGQLDVIQQRREQQEKERS